jgi:hypothetical protein
MIMVGHLFQGTQLTDSWLLQGNWVVLMTML